MKPAAAVELSDPATPPQSTPDPIRLAIDIDVDVCIIGAGLAGLSVALEAARRGAQVVVLEGRHIGWGASGNQLGAVVPGFDISPATLIDRIGPDAAREMWRLAAEGARSIHDLASGSLSVPTVAGALEVSRVDSRSHLDERMNLLSGQFGVAVEGWQVDRVRDALKTDRYFHALHYPDAFQVEPRAYLRELAKRARAAGVRIFEQTPVVDVDPVGIRKRIVTPDARVRASQIVFAGSIHLGDPQRRLVNTLVPVWRYGGITEPLGERLADVGSFRRLGV